jgi:putative hydrolase of the HAD superfamily
MPYAPDVLRTHITTVILDFGGVLGLPLDPRRAAEMADLCGLSIAEFLHLYQPDRLELDRGTLPAGEYWGRILMAAGKEPKPELIARLERTDALGWLQINTKVVSWTAELRAAGYHMGLLSNMPPEKLAFMKRDPAYRWLDSFQATVFSCTCALVKPEPEIYRLCLQRLGARPAECLFLDDTPLNLEAARALGINALLFRGAEEAAPALRKEWGLPVYSLTG